jgi:hypothetical protein
MKKSTLIYIGVGAVAYYLFYQWNKKFTKAFGGGGGNNQAPPREDVINKGKVCKEGFELKETTMKCSMPPCPTIKSCVVKGSVSNQPIGLNKEALFNSTIKFKGGARIGCGLNDLGCRMQEKLREEDWQRKQKELQARIDQLGLRAEYDAWYKKRQELMKDAPLPS